VLFSEWETFYVIVGSSGAALTGLMFVVITLMADNRREAPGETLASFGTPTVVHLSAVLLMSAIMTAPWPSITGPRVALGLSGGTGVIYVLIVLARARRQVGYQPVFEDWLFHIILPFLAYAIVLLAAVTLINKEAITQLFVIGGASLLLIFISLHNAWDTVTYVVVEQLEKRARGEDPKKDA
jgi:hypothetical protein